MSAMPPSKSIALHGCVVALDCLRIYSGAQKNAVRVRVFASLAGVYDVNTEVHKYTVRVCVFAALFSVYERFRFTKTLINTTSRS